MPWGRWLKSGRIPLSAERAPGAPGRRRVGAGRAGALLSRQRREKGQGLHPGPDPVRCQQLHKFPAAPGARGESSGSSSPAADPTRPPALPREGAEPRLALRSGCTRCRQPWRSRERARPARRLSAGSREPSPRRLHALSLLPERRAVPRGQTEGSAHAGRQHPAPPARVRVRGDHGASERGIPVCGGRRQAVTRGVKRRGGFPSSAPSPAVSSVRRRLPGGDALCEGCASAKSLSGSGAASSFESAAGGTSGLRPQPGGSVPAACRQCHPARPGAPRVTGPAFHRGSAAGRGKRRELRASSLHPGSLARRPRGTDAVLSPEHYEVGRARPLCCASAVQFTYFCIMYSLTNYCSYDYF